MYSVGNDINSILGVSSNDYTTNSTNLVATTKCVYDGIQSNKPNLSNYVNKSGSRGSLVGYESATTLSGNQTITIESADTIIMNTSGSVTLTFTPSSSVNECAVKVVSLKSTGTTTLTISGAVWANGGEAPTWGTTGKTLILVANFIHGKCVLNIFHNDEA